MDCGQSSVNLVGSASHSPVKEMVSSGAFRAAEIITDALHNSESRSFLESRIRARSAVI